jgi:hypothetical protein
MALSKEEQKQMDELVELNKQLLKRAEDAATENVALKKQIDGLIAKAEDGAECKMEDGSMGTMLGGKCVAKVDKAALPEAVRKQLDEQSEAIKKSNETIAKLLDEKEQKEWVAKAAVHKHLPIKPEGLGPILKAASASLSAEQMTELDRVFKAADEAFATVLKMTGSARGGDGDTAHEKLTALAKSHAAEKGVTFEKAYTAVLAANPELARQHREEARAARSGN